MSSVNTVPMPELSDEQIAAARERRRASAPADDVTSAADIGKMGALPANHPWATARPVSPEEEEAKRQAVLRMNSTRRIRQEEEDGGAARPAKRA